MSRSLSELLRSLFPFFIIVGIWIVIMIRVKRGNKTARNSYDIKHDEMTRLLGEIRDELKELNKNNSQKQ